MCITYLVTGRHRHGAFKTFIKISILEKNLSKVIQNTVQALRHGQQLGYRLETVSGKVDLFKNLSSLIHTGFILALSMQI